MLNTEFFKMKNRALNKLQTHKFLKRQLGFINSKQNTDSCMVTLGDNFYPVEHESSFPATKFRMISGMVGSSPLRRSIPASSMSV
jgi:hypothetical protein